MLWPHPESPKPLQAQHPRFFASSLPVLPSRNSSRRLDSPELFCASIDINWPLARHRPRSRPAGAFVTSREVCHHTLSLSIITNSPSLLSLQAAPGGLG